MQNSYTKIHYNEKLRPYSEFPVLLCKHLADNYFKSREGKLLDVCCGRGEFVRIYNELGFETYGIDKESSHHAQDLNIEIADIDQENLPFADEFFEFIMIKSAIEHIRNVYHLMENIHRVLKPGGKLIILTCDWKIAYKIFFDDVDHKTPFTKWSLHDLLARYDFKNVVTEDIFYLPFTWRNKIFKMIPRIIMRTVPIDFPCTVKLTPLIKLIKFSREKQIIAFGEK